MEGQTETIADGSFALLKKLYSAGSRRVNNVLVQNITFRPCRFVYFFVKSGVPTGISGFPV
jgi:hypothetical protein